jgi:Regulator of ribonuclease activity B
MLPGQGKTTRAVERFHDAGEADEHVLDHLARLGCDPSEPRETRHFLYLPAQDGADAVARSLQADGWSTSVEQSEGAWLLVATRARTLTLDVVRETRARLAALASEHGGLYDGWEVPVD